jgi:tetratricopeptide (TPR) repeat protein
MLNRESKWWCDGDYDGDKAEIFNDKGCASFGKKEYGEAFDAFTRAISLWPSRAAYHCNRSSVALKLGKFDVCASDCQEGLRLDPSNVKVLMRRATVLQKLGKVEESKAAWQRALEKDAGNRKAKAGYLEACREAERKRLKDLREKEKSQSGSRTALPLRLDLSKEEEEEEDWSNRLYSCREMLKYEDSLSAKLSVVEALIMCRRYPDALRMLQEEEGQLEKKMKKKGESERGSTDMDTERLYLTAEAKWRSGLVGEASALLGRVQRSRRVEKCIKLARHVDKIQALVEQGQSAFDDERFLDAIDAWAEIEKVIQPQACSGLYALAMRQKASALLCRNSSGGGLKEALECLDGALQWEPEDQQCLLLRSRVKDKRKDYRGALADLSILQSVNPSTPGLFRRMQRLACIMLEGKGDSKYKAESVKKRFGFDPYEVLGVDGGAEDLVVRRAYRQLAAKWHPDKWLQKTDEQQQAASVKFKEIKKAYETLTTTGDDP